MKLHQQFDLNVNILDNDTIEHISKKLNRIPELIEVLSKNLIQKGYAVIISSAYYMGLPQSITVMKDFSGPFVMLYSTKIKKDFENISKTLGIGKLFK